MRRSFFFVLFWMLPGALPLTVTPATSNAQANDCRAGYERQGLLCYPRCPKGYEGQLNFCYEHCPKGYADAGPTCFLGADTKGRPSHHSNDYWSNFDGSGHKRCEKVHGKGKCVDIGGVGYPKCRSGYSRGVPLTTCYGKCPAGYNELPATCQRDPKSIRRKTKDRGPGEPLESVKRDFAVLGKGLRDAVCAMSGPICPIIDLVIMLTDDKKRDKWAASVKKKMVEMGSSFTNLLTRMTPDNVGPEAEKFFKGTARALEGILRKIMPPIFPPIDEAVHKVVAYSLSGTMTPAGILMATLHFAAKKFMAWFLPELIFATGDLAGRMDSQAKKSTVSGTNQKSKNDTNELLKIVVDVLKTVAGVGLGVVANLQTPEKKEKMRAAIEKALGVAEKVKAASERALALAAKQARGETVSEAERDAILDVDLVKKNPIGFLRALAPVVTDEVWLSVQEVLRKVIGKLLASLAKVLDIPRNAVVGAVGTIPFVGGVLASLLNFGMGFLVDALLDLLGNQLLEMAKTIVVDVLSSRQPGNEGLFPAIEKQLTGKNPKAQKKVAGFASFLQFAQGLMGEITQFLIDARESMKQNIAQVIAKGTGKVAGQVLEQVLSRLKGIPAGVASLVREVFDRMGDAGRALAESPVVAKTVVAKVVKAAAPIGDYFLGLVPDAPLRRMLLAGHSLVVDGLQDVTVIAQDPARFASGIADTVGIYAKEQLDKALAHKSVAPERALAGNSLDAMLDVLRAPSALFPKGRAPDVGAILGKVASVAEPYASARLRGLVEGTGLEALIELFVKAFFSADGPLRKGATFFSGLTTLFKDKGLSMLGQVLVAMAPFASKQVDRAGGRVSGAAVEGLFTAIGKALDLPGGIDALTKGGAEPILTAAKNVFLPLLQSIVPGLELGRSGDGDAALRRRLAQGELARAGRRPISACRSDIESLLRDVSGIVMSAFKNPARIKAEPGKLVLELAMALGRGLKDTVRNAVLDLPMDAGVKPFLGNLLDSLFDLLANATEITKFRGPQAMTVISRGASLLLPYVKEKLGLAIPSNARELVFAIVDDLQQAVKSPEAVNALIGGTTKDYVVRAVRVVGPSLVKLLASALPSNVQSTVAGLLEKVRAMLAAPEQLAKAPAMTAVTLARELAVLVKPALAAVLRAVPGSPASTVDEAFTIVFALLDDAAAAAQGARQRAAAAFDQKLSPLVVRIEHAALRELAAGLLAILRELVVLGTSSGVGANVSTLWHRLATLGGRFVSGLLAEVIPAGEVRTFIEAAIAALVDVFSQPSGVAAALAQKGTGLLAASAKRIGNAFVALLRQHIAEPLVATLLGELTRAVLELITDADRFRALGKEGIGVILGLFAPAVERFVIAAVAQVNRLPQELRAFLESFVRAMSGLLTDERQRAELTTRPGAALLRAGLGGFKVFVQGQIGRAEPVAVLVGKGFDVLTDVLLDEAARNRFFALTTARAFADVVPHVQGMLSAYSRRVADPATRALLEATSSTLLGKAAQIALSPTNAVALVKEAVASRSGLAAALLALLKTKLSEALRGSPPELGTFAQTALASLERFGLAMLNDPKAWKQNIGDGATVLLRGLFDWLLASAKRNISRAVTHAPLQRFVFGLLDGLRDIAADPLGMAAAIERARRDGPTPVLALTLPRLADALDPFLASEGVAKMPAGVLREALRIAVNEVMSLLRKPADLVAIIGEVSRGDWTALKTRLLRFLDKMIGAFDADPKTRGLAGPMRAALSALMSASAAGGG
jgi:hypothetical protein